MSFYEDGLSFIVSDMETKDWKKSITLFLNVIT
jgi:hypothetical protein